MSNAHLAFRTKFTRQGVRDMWNKKPYRTKEQKIEARATAEKVNGTYVSRAPRSFHLPPNTKKED